MLLTTVRAMASRATGPALVAPLGPAKGAVNVTPGGMAALSCAISRRLFDLVPTVYVVVASVRDTRPVPATAVLIAIGAGDPDTETSCARAVVAKAASTTIPPAARQRRAAAGRGTRV